MPDPTDPCNQTIDTTPLQSPMFQLNIQRLPTTTYFIQRANIPGMQGGTAEQRLPMGSKMKFPGGSFDHGLLVAQFFLDQSFLAWWDVYRWMQECYGITDSKNTVAPVNMQSDINLMILDNNRNPAFGFTYVKAWPTSITEIQFDSTVKDILPITATATFDYQYIRFVNAKDAASTVTTPTWAGPGVSINRADGQLKTGADC